jgi:hypothetical protein
MAIEFQRFSLHSLPKLPRNSANSVELLIFVMNHGSGPEAVAICSRMGFPMGVGPKAIEWPDFATVM